jgi:hypothetical protein
MAYVFAIPWAVTKIVIPALVFWNAVTLRAIPLAAVVVALPTSARILESAVKRLLASPAYANALFAITLLAIGLVLWRPSRHRRRNVETSDQMIITVAYAVKDAATSTASAARAALMRTGTNVMLTHSLRVACRECVESYSWTSAF